MSVQEAQDIFQCCKFNKRTWLRHVGHSSSTAKMLILDIILWNENYFIYLGCSVIFSIWLPRNEGMEAHGNEEGWEDGQWDRGLKTTLMPDKTINIESCKTPYYVQCQNFKKCAQMFCIPTMVYLSLGKDCGCGKYILVMV